MMQGLVSVVIANYNRCRELRQALLSVRIQDYDHREILVVDNASGDDSLRMLAEEFPEVTVLPMSENRGMDGYSEGFRRARGEFIFQMDNDSLMSEATVLSEVVARFRRGPEALGVVAARVEEFRQGDQVERLRARDTRRGPIETGGFHGGGVGFRKGALDEVGSYNRDVFLYGAELFLQMRFLAAGYRICYYPEILMLHTRAPAARSNQGLYYEVRNRLWAMRCFARKRERWSIVPRMLAHDLAYSLYRRAPGMFGMALWSGLIAPLPPSLRTPVLSENEAFRKKVREMGTTFSIRSTFARALARIRGTGERGEGGDNG